MTKLVRPGWLVVRSGLISRLELGSIPKGRTIFNGGRVKYVILTLLLTGCGLPRHYDSNPDFDAYTARFEQETGVKVTVPIVYSSLDKETVALCEEFSDGYRLIRVNSFYWEEMENGGKEETIYHELGHCQLNRDHSDELTTTRLYVYAIPNSIMYPYIFGDVSFYWIFRDHYVQELMSPGKRLEF